MDFVDIYHYYYPKLVRFATEYVVEQEEAENIVQDIFLMLWEQKQTLSHIENIQAYLYNITKHKCIDFLRHRLVIINKKKLLQDIRMQEYTYNLLSIQQIDDSFFSDPEIDQTLHKAIQSLPEQCRRIFILSRFENMSHQQIAVQLDISPSTVNNQIAVAMKKLREKLKHILSILISLGV